MNNVQPNQLRILAADGDESVLDLYQEALYPENNNNRLFAGIGELAAQLYVKNADTENTLSLFPELDIICCCHADEAIETARKAVEENRPFAVAFIDIQIAPEHDGIRVAEYIRRMDPYVEIVLVTALPPSTSPQPAIHAIKLACRIPPANKLLFIQKPLRGQEIFQFSSALASKWLVEREFRNIQHDLEKRVEERTDALQKERNFISAVLDTAGALVIVLNRQGQVAQFNRVCEEISGCTFSEVKDRHIWDLFLVPEEVMPIKAVFDNIRDGRFPNKHENYWVTKCGSRRLITWSSTALLNDEETVEYGIWIGLDITERKKTEEDLRSSEERYRALIENVKDGVALIQNGKLIFTNDAFSSMFGYDRPSELIGTKVLTLVDSHFEPGFTKFLNTALDKKSWGLPFKGKCITKEGREFWAEKTSSVITHEGKPAILVAVRDITDNMLWEQTIKQEAEYFRSENVRLKSSIGDRYKLVNIIGKSPVMQQVYELIIKAAETDANVIIFGKSGTGKELAAKAVHEMSASSGNPFVPVNCGAIPETLIESEFFGYKKGAFTGANMDKKGYLYTADKGTLFLDEVGDIGLNMQVKLLRVIEGGDYIPVGDRKPLHADVRIIAATNKDLPDMVNRGLMREDFFYRISVIPITMPDLKDRKDDIPLLVEHFLTLYGAKKQTIPVKVMDALLNYDWPGNVRELQNVLQRFITVKSLDFMNISADTQNADSLDFSDEEPGQDGYSLDEVVESVEKKLIIQALEKVRWNKTKASSLLGISRRSLFRRMKKLGV
ncbi:MAG: PAS domain S-box protein [Desulfobacteraceae bacterium]|nr:PAS domain S-box protein [Desulfobacteraceae bacterium]